LVDRLKARGLKIADLADDWDVSYNTVRNAIYWPTGRPPSPERLTALEELAALPNDTLLEQYFTKRPDPAYWETYADVPEDEPELASADAGPPAKVAPVKAAPRKATAALAVKTSTAGDVEPVITVEPVSEYDEMSKLRRRIGHLERVLVAVAPLIAKGAGVDEDQLLAAMRLGS
jgi:hypothetical protein